MKLSLKKLKLFCLLIGFSAITFSATVNQSVDNNNIESTALIHTDFVNSSELVNSTESIESRVEQRQQANLLLEIDSVIPESIIANQDIEVLELSLTKQIANREPGDRLENFSLSDTKAYVFARLNIQAAGEIIFIWSRDGQECHRSVLAVQQAQSWRTHSWVSLKPGQWKVQLISNNKLLAEKVFGVS